MKKNVHTTDAARMTVSIRTDRRLRVEFDGDPALLAEFEMRWQKRPQKVQAAFQRFVIAQAKGATPTVRERKGTFNAQIPSAIHAQFKAACSIAEPPITQIDAIKLVLQRYIHIATAARRTLYDDDHHAMRDRYGQRRKRAPHRQEFEDPVFNASPTQKMQVDLGPRLKAVVEDLIADVGIGKSRFFTFVLSEAVLVIERKAQEPKMSNGPAAQQFDLD